MTKKNASKLYFIIILLLIITANILIFRSINDYESEINHFSSAKLNFAGNTGTKEVFLSNKNNIPRIVIRKNLFHYCSTKLSGFENLIEIKPLIGFGDNTKIIEVGGFVGVHSENRQYFILDSNFCPKVVKFVKNGVKANNVFSDEPNYFFDDYNDDGLMELFVESRNYDENPLTNVFRKVYHYDKSLNIFSYIDTLNYSY